MTDHISSFTADLIGFAGMICIVSAFAYSNVVKQMNMILFNLTNFAGAVLLTISLLVNFNLPTLVLEIVWMAIALFGLGKELIQRRRAAS
ncbi:CBU_0592 family membrane protein [Altererythrobacter aquiaggeris]|uniref:CBU_0592 family membrane protein n=1 Tax=Aestuarierythrobacter aquiaggeris TaxID=1898396 RepID=UPI00301AC499